MIFLRQIAAKDCKGRQGTANGGKGVYTHIADFYRSRGTDYTENRSFCLFRGSLSPYFLFIGLFRGEYRKGVRRFFRQIFTILTSLIVKMGPLKLSSLPLNDRSFSV